MEVALPALGLALTIALTASGCGTYGGSYSNHASKDAYGSSGRSAKGSTSSGGITYEDGTLGGTGGTQSGATDGSGSSSSTTSSGGTAPTYSYDVGGVGYSTQTFTVYTNKVLKIQFTPGVANKTVANTGFTPQYSKLAVFIAVGGNEQATALLSNGLDGSGSQSSAVLNFSNSFTRTCGSDTSCRQSVTVTVSKPNYDYWCYNYGMYCDHTHVYNSHPWNGTVMIQTDDTVAL